MLLSLGHLPHSAAVPQFPLSSAAVLSVEDFLFSFTSHITFNFMQIPASPKHIHAHSKSVSIYNPTVGPVAASTSILHFRSVGSYLLTHADFLEPLLDCLHMKKDVSSRGLEHEGGNPWELTPVPFSAGLYPMVSLKKIPDQSLISEVQGWDAALCLASQDPAFHHLMVTSQS